MDAPDRDKPQPQLEIGPVSGFPEWLPPVRLAEQLILDSVRRTYELYGFTPIETPAVERLSVLAAKGGIESQIFTLGRPAQEESSDPSSLGLHFDLTVPLARYVAQHQNELTFPFRRYQIQKVWRGERAQKGRFREFYQCDIDIVGRHELSILYDAEIPSVINSTCESLGLSDFCVHISNRKILGRLLEAFGLDGEATNQVLRVVDKHGARQRGLLSALTALELPADLADSVSALATSKTIEEAGELLQRAGARADGVEELSAVIRASLDLGMPPERLRLDLSIARGLDYYTGSVYETFVTGKEKWGSICSGGRYDDLASHFTDGRFPGVGVSIGLSRLFHLLVQAEQVDVDRPSPVEVLVTMQDRETFLSEYLALASLLRQAGIPTEVFLGSDGLGKQLKYAARKRVPVVVIAGSEEFSSGTLALKDMFQGTQREVAAADLVTEVRSLLAREAE